MARYTSPPGTWEAIWKDLLEDWTLADAERSLMVYLATLPDGWIVHPKHLASVTGRSANWVRLTLRGLAARGIIVTTRPHEPDGTFGKPVTRLRKGQLVAPLTPPAPGRGQTPGHHEKGIPPRGADLGGHHETPGRHHEGGSPPGGETTPIVTTHRPSDDSQGQDLETGGNYEDPPRPPRRLSGGAPDRQADQGHTPSAGGLTGTTGNGRGPGDHHLDPGQDHEVRQAPGRGQDGSDEKQAAQLAAVAAGFDQAVPGWRDEPWAAKYRDLPGPPDPGAG